MNRLQREALAYEKGNKQMTGNFSVLQEGSTLIGDHSTAVNALTDMAGAKTLAEAQKIATDALLKLGEVVNPEATGVHGKLQNRDPK